MKYLMFIALLTLFAASLLTVTLGMASPLVLWAFAPVLALPLILRRLRWRTLVVFLMPLLPLLAAAATSNASPPAPTPPSWLSALIPVGVPIAITAIKMFLPKLPTWTLPTIVAPVLGVVADLTLHYAGVSTMGPMWGAMLGSAGVGLREIQDQVKQQLAGPAAPPTIGG